MTQNDDKTLKCSKANCWLDPGQGVFVSGKGFRYLQEGEGMHLDCYIEHVIDTILDNLEIWD